MVLGLGDHGSGGSKQSVQIVKTKVSESLLRGELSRVFEDTWGVSRGVVDVQKETGMYTSKTWSSENMWYIS